MHAQRSRPQFFFKNDYIFFNLGLRADITRCLSGEKRAEKVAQDRDILTYSHWEEKFQWTLVTEKKTIFDFQGNFSSNKI